MESEAAEEPSVRIGEQRGDVVVSGHGVLVLAFLGSTVTEIRLAIGRKLGVTDGIGFRVAQHLLAWTILPAPVFHASVIWGGAVTSPVVWRHVRYVVDKTGQVIDVARAVCGRDIPVRFGPRRPGDPAVLVASSELIMGELGWRPRLQDLREIVASAWQFKSR